MKKLLLSSLLFLLSASAVLAYETVIIKYPDGELWEPVYYRKNFAEGIVQYVRKGETTKEWSRSVIIHSYNEYYGTAKTLMNSVIDLNTAQNPTGRYRIIKDSTDDVIAVRCTTEYKHLVPQCEILRAARGHNGVITLHYIDKNISHFRLNHEDWFERIKKAVFYESYFRNDRILNKSMYLEL